MKVLVVGGCHVYGYGIEKGKGFVQQTLDKLRLEYQTEIEVTYYAPFKLDKAIRLFMLQPSLSKQFDIIILQLGHFELTHQDVFKRFFDESTAFNQQMYPASETDLCKLVPANINELHAVSPAHKFEKKKLNLEVVKSGLRLQLKLAFLKAYHWFKPIGRLRGFRHQVEELVTLLDGAQQKTVWIAPAPVSDKISNFLRQQGRAILLKVCKSAHFQVIDPVQVIDHPEEGIASDGFHINEYFHTLLAKALLQRIKIAGVLQNWPYPYKHAS